MPKLKPEESVKFDKRIFNARPWYHNFSSLGFQTYFPNSSVGSMLSEYTPKYLLKRFFQSPLKFMKNAQNLLSGKSSMWCEWAMQNQGQKEKFILPYITEAVAACRKKGVKKPSTLDMFCADGYYSFWMRKILNTGTATAIDLDKRGMELGKLMNSVLGEDVNFINMDVFNVPETDKYDIVLCTGGLYHIRDPEKLLKLCRKITRGFLIVQTVVTIETEDKDYFISPAPGWKHGCRFADAKLMGWLKKAGWKVIKHNRNELHANKELSNRGSVYYLCKPA